MKAGKGRNKDGGKGTKKPQLSGEDRDIWEHSMRDVRPLKKKDAGTAAKIPAKNSTKGLHDNKFQFIDIISNNFISPVDQIDRKTEERLRKGLMPIDARLDLHCMTQDQAYSALKKFIRHGYETGCRCVLVITGTGTRHRSADAGRPWYEGMPGVLSERVPEWLQDGELRRIVLRCYPAQKRHGGAGALYVLIRRRRER